MDIFRGKGESPRKHLENFGLFWVLVLSLNSQILVVRIERVWKYRILCWAERTAWVESSQVRALERVKGWWSHFPTHASKSLLSYKLSYKQRRRLAWTIPMNTWNEQCRISQAPDTKKWFSLSLKETPEPNSAEYSLPRHLRPTKMILLLISVIHNYFHYIWGFLG